MPGQLATHGEKLLVALAADFDEFVGRQGPPLGLGEFLQAGLVVLAQGAIGEVPARIGNPALDEGPASIETAIEINRRNQRLHCRGQDRFPPPAAAAGFPGAELDRFAEVDLPGDQGQRGPAHDLGPHDCQVALVGLRVGVPGQLGDEEAKQRVAEEFEPLVVLPVGAAVGQGEFGEGRVAEFIADGLLEGFECGGHGWKRVGSAR